MSGVSDVPQGLPVPLSTDEACRKRIAALNVETEALEGKLQVRISAVALLCQGWWGHVGGHSQQRLVGPCWISCWQAMLGLPGGWAGELGPEALLALCGRSWAAAGAY